MFWNCLNWLFDVFWRRNQISKGSFAMRIQLQSVSLIVLMLSCGAAQADEGQRGWGRFTCFGKNPWSYVPEDPALLKSELELGPWFNECAARIKATALKQPKEVVGNNSVFCTFNLRENGDIYNLKIQHTSGDPAVDEAALAVLRESAPFKPASDALAYEKQILVEFRGNVPKLDSPVITMKLTNRVQFLPRAAAH
jgi:TonB family protein